MKKEPGGRLLFRVGMSGQNYQGNQLTVATASVAVRATFLPGFASLLLVIGKVTGVVLSALGFSSLGSNLALLLFVH